MFSVVIKHLVISLPINYQFTMEPRVFQIIEAEVLCTEVLSATFHITMYSCENGRVNESASFNAVYRHSDTWMT